MLALFIIDSHLAMIYVMRCWDLGVKITDVHQMILAELRGLKWISSVERKVELEMRLLAKHSRIGPRHIARWHR